MYSILSPLDTQLKALAGVKSYAVSAWAEMTAMILSHQQSALGNLLRLDAIAGYDLTASMDTTNHFQHHVSLP